ncbi:hypothetical protein LEM8419_00370 [Neolewinella maritima]|uniref:ATP-grasp domain-containing protein n=1 Tax=Neolewinella maritima TaxID=1383882 RepID=A0ABN8F4M8_9BACT|nr:hypothetical protein [Neolewinella maritima]CAH0999075.1 hypothetical protein LEM8419_00370 [Neolewinella maritima]
MRNSTTSVSPGSFKAEAHWYPKALNATIHPMVSFFLNLDRERIVSRYCHLNPLVDPDGLREILAYQCKYFLWGGADLINATTAQGRRRMVIIENNSCPSGQKSMPLLDDHQEEGSYRLLVERTFRPYVERRGNKKDGRLAVIYDKNPMESSGYAATIADVFQEDVLYISDYYGADERKLKVENDWLYALHEGEWVRLRAAFRYLTQRPWTRLPLNCKTRILNPIVTCLAGGRNKMVAAKAYDFYNGEIRKWGLKIHTPETIWDVSRNEIPLWVAKLGGQAVVKVPYSNAGQGVYTITNQGELDAFMAEPIDYERFIVQSLIGNYGWSSTGGDGKFFHVGTIPDKKGRTFVSDVRLMVSSTASGIRPLACYSRRAEQALSDQLDAGTDSWAMLGTNLSEKLADNQWGSDTNRLLLMDRRDFNKLGIGLDDLIEAYIQTVLSTVAIDKMATKLFNSKGKFSLRLFSSLNDDPVLLSEILA